MVCERVLLEIVVRGADVRIAQHLAHEHNRGIVIALSVGAIHDDLNAVFVLEVVEGLLLVSHNDDDVENPSFV